MFRVVSQDESVGGWLFVHSVGASPSHGPRFEPETLYLGLAARLGRAGCSLPPYYCQ